MTAGVNLPSGNGGSGSFLGSAWKFAKTMTKVSLLAGTGIYLFGSEEGPFTAAGNLVHGIFNVAAVQTSPIAADIGGAVDSPYKAAIDPQKALYTQAKEFIVGQQP